MSHWELSQGLTDDYYTPLPVFTALNCGKFDMDVAAAHHPDNAFVWADVYLTEKGLETDWIGFVWCNPPYGKRGTKLPWVEKLLKHGAGLLLMPDRTNADWWQVAAKGCSDFLTAYHKIKFLSPDGTVNTQPSTGNTIFAFGERALDAVRQAEDNKFGMTHRGLPSIILVGISPSWAGIIEIAMDRLKGKGSVKEIYEAVERLAPDKIQGNVHWKEKIRQKLQEHFTRVDKGIYSRTLN